MGDSWEERANEGGEEIVLKPLPGKKDSGGLSLNPGASSFSFNPTASNFDPSGGAGATFAPAEPPPKPKVSLGLPPPKNPFTAVIGKSEPEAAPANGAPARTESTGTKDDSSQKGADAAAKEVKKLAVSNDEDFVETDAQKAAREAEVRKTLEEINAEDPREHLNVVFIGHVDAGKSTTAGQILFLTGGVDDRTIEKYEREAKDNNRESWYMAYIMDTNEEERAKGITVEVGRALFETPKKRYTILDAPGHKNYVPNMIAGASQADVGVLVISARKGEFETGFEKGGQTREHAQLAKTLGVQKLIVVVNKMDDPTMVLEGGVWNKERYDEIETKVTPFLRGCGYNTKKDVVFLPISGLLGANVRDPVDPAKCPWYDNGPTLFQVLDDIEPASRDPYAPFRMPIMDRYRDMGTIVMGKGESGVVKKGDALMIMPNKTQVKVVAVYRDEKEVNAAKPGENLRLRLSGVEEDDISTGFVLSSRFQPVPNVVTFEAQIAILELLEHKPILTGGYKAVLHVHSVVEECEVIKLVAVIDPKTKEKKKAKYVKSGSICIARIAVEKPICVETFDSVPQLGRFTLRDEGKTIAIGKITRLPHTKKKETD